MRVIGPYFVPDRLGRSSLDAVENALHDAQSRGCRAAAIVVERDDGSIYTYAGSRMSAERRRALADALAERLTTG